MELWSYIDAHDGAQAVACAPEHPTPGFESFVTANQDTVMTRSSADLLAEFFPGVEFRFPVEGAESLIFTAKAQRVLGWTPTRSWRGQGLTP